MHPNPTEPVAGAPAQTRRRSRLAFAIPFAVAIATLSVLAWSAWPVIKPARTVTVTQAVFDRSTQAATSATTDAPAPRSTKTVQAAGWLEAEPYLVACTALADGVVDSIHVLEGDWVDKGQTVAQLVPDDAELSLRRADAALAVARADESLAESDFAAAQSAWDNPVELDRAVDAGRAAHAEGEGELAQLPALIDAARAKLARLAEQRDRAEQSHASGAATELEVFVAKQEVLAQQAEVEALEARAPILQARVARLAADLRAAERDLSLRIEDRRRLDAARAELTRAQSAVARALAARDESALELERMTIRAPISGYVQTRLKIPGDKVMRAMDAEHSAHLVHIYDPSRIQVRVDVPLADAANIFTDQRCEVVVEILPDRTFAGEVLRITHEADLQKNTLQIKVRVIDPDPVLRPEMLTRVRFLPDIPEGATGTPAASDTPVLIPADALDEKAGAARVWLVTQRQSDRGVVRPVAVTPGTRSDGWVAVRGPVQPGALIALPDQNLRDGQSVRFGESEGGAS